VLALQKSDHADQAAMVDEQSWKATSSHKLAPTMTVSVEGSATATYEPEMACFDIRVSAQKDTKQSARIAWATAADHLHEFLDGHPSVGKWESFPERLYNDEKEMSRWSRSKDQEATGPTVTSRFTGRVDSINAVDSLVKNLTSMEHVSISWINYDLSEATKATAKIGVKKAAVKDCFEAGQLYVDMLEYSTIEVVGIDEQYIFFDQHSDSFRYYDEDASSELQKVVAQTTVKCSMRLF